MANSDRTAGSMKDAKGDLKKAAGEFLGDRELKREGNADKAEGKLQKGFGKIRDMFRGRRDV
jgi:uncharacterized protein YjbJ (UPF0337 family)